MLTYATRHGHTFLDRRLYLPEEWCTDQERRAKAKMSKEVVFQTKPEQSIAMLEHAWEQGVPMRWVAGDEVYGNDPRVRDTVIAHQRLYVLAVSSNTPVWGERPTVEEPTREETVGRPRTKVRLAPGEPPPTTVAAEVANWSADRWQRLTVAEGEKGPRTHDWACARVVESRDGLPGPDAWLLARRSITDPSDIAYYLSNAPLDTSLLKLAQVASPFHCRTVY